MAQSRSHDPLRDAEEGQSPIEINNDLNTPTDTWKSEKTAVPSPGGRSPVTPTSTKPWIQRVSSSFFGGEKAVMRDSEPIIRSIDNSPLGYPLLAAFLDSEENFMIYRRFGFLHARLLLQKQDQLRIMEEALQDMDEVDAASDEGKAILMCREDDEHQDLPEGESRTELLEKIEKTLISYDQLLLNSQQLVLANRPASRDYSSVKNFFRNREPLIEGDRDFIYNSEDLLTLRPGRETAWLDGFIERLLKFFPLKVQHLFRSEETSRKSVDPNIRYFTKSRIDALVNVVILAMILALLVVPVYGLYHVTYSYDASNLQKSNAVCIGIFLVATLLFSAVLSLFTKAKRHEILAASAAYCAILVVFFGNIGIQNAQVLPKT